MSARLKLTIALVFVGLLLFQAGTWWFALLFEPWQFCVAVVLIGAALTGLGFLVAPPDPRRPRGGPMVDPDKTIVINTKNTGPNSDKEPN